MKLNWGAIRAIFRRDLRLYFSNPTGYVFITLFIFLAAAAAFWQERFFLNNLANLDQLNTAFPFLLLFFIPAITMGVWAEERKQGTDELLLTLPATDVEVVLGKYISTIGIYSAALVLSLVGHLGVLFWLGNPDLGLMLGNYIGYWFLGAAFIAVGMLASMISVNATVAFILGAILCAFFVYIEQVLGIAGKSLEAFGRSLAVFDAFSGFTRGIVSLAGALYFTSIAVFALYLNVVLLGRRHWPRDAGGMKMSMHHLVRGAALAVALIALNAMVARTSARVDVTAEKLHSLSGETRQLIAEIPDERPVFIQAFVSPDVPRQMVQTRSTLIGFLEEIDAVAGDKVQVVIYDTEPFSEEALQAREQFGILARETPEIGASRAKVSQVFMGVAFTCGPEEDVIEFFDRGLPAEYELARSIRVVARTQRKKIGVLTTQAKVFGGFDFNTFASSPAWPVVDELKKQYEVVQIAASDPITEEMDALLAILPSSLSQPEMDNLHSYVEAGKPTLLLVDPLLVANLSLSPSEESGAGTNPFMRNRGPQPEPKGAIGALMASAGVNWNIAQVVWDAYNPHPELSTLPPEVVFVGRGNENPNAFNDSAPISSGLQEIVMLFPGTITGLNTPGLSFQPLLATSVRSGSVAYNQVVSKDFFGSRLVPQAAPHMVSSNDYVLAGHVTGTDTIPRNVIVVADVDFISDQFFEIRRQGIENLNFDNISFFLNCIDILAGDDSFLSLRKRRVRHRTLETVEARVRAFSEQSATDQQAAEMEAQEALAAAQQRLDERVAQVRQRTDLDAQAKQIMSRNLQEVENRKFEAIKANIEAQKDLKVQESKEKMEAQVRRIQSNIKTFAGLLPPIPVFAMGIMIYLRRRRREREGAAAARRLRN